MARSYTPCRDEWGPATTPLDERPPCGRALVQRESGTLRHSTVGVCPASMAAAPEKRQREQALHCALHVRDLCVALDGTL